MSLTGEVTDLSLAELIEFFCNQRKAGRLEVVCRDGSGHFYLDSGSIVHAQIGVLNGIEAVHYALTLPSASFTFGSGIEAPEQTITQSWQSVVLEGLRLIDEGVTPPPAFPEKTELTLKEVESIEQRVETPEPRKPFLAPRQRSLVDTIPLRRPSARLDRAIEVPAFLAEAETSRSVYGPWKLALVLTAMILVLAVIAVPWGWYARSRAAKLADAKSVSSEVPQSSPKTTNPGESPAPAANMTIAPEEVSETKNQLPKTEPGEKERANQKK